MTNKIAIFGYGQIGKGVDECIRGFSSALYGRPTSFKPLIIDSIIVPDVNICVMDISTSTVEEITRVLKSSGITYVFNAMPFRFNEKIATAALAARASYIDFTEDDMMADRVKEIYTGSGLNCAVKCGLAPGFINYLGLALVKKIHKPESLMVSVGALPRMVSYDPLHPENSYNLSWSVDGLVNEYIRPCRIKRNNINREIEALSEIETVILDGTTYEAAHTSGGIGSLVVDLPDVPNIHYKTLRYPGHFSFIKEYAASQLWDFDKIKQGFLKMFPYNDQDVIIVYAKATGEDINGNKIIKNYSSKFHGINGLSGIQATTAGSGVAMLELMVTKKIQGVVSHADVNFEQFTNTLTFRKYYLKD